MTVKQNEWKVSECFAPRPTHFRELYEYKGWRFKVYEIIYGSEPLDWPTYQNGLDLASKEFPISAQTKKRPGVGFIICHQGRDWHYLVVSWWNNENELVIEVYVKKIGEENNWRKAEQGQSICVWDLEIIWFERNSFIETILSKPNSPDVEAYLGHKLNIDV